MSRLALLQHLTKVEDKIQGLYDQAAREIKRLPVDPKSRAEAKAIMRAIDDEVRGLIFDSIKKGADLGEEDAMKRALDVMRKGWGNARK